MTNKGFNPLFISALDILLNTLGVFIILNFLNARLAGVPPVPVNPPAKEQKQEAPKPIAEAKPGPAEPRAWWRKPPPDEPVKPQTPPQPATPKPDGKPATETATPQPQAPAVPQDPVAVDLMRQTKGAVVILLQQADQSKTSVEFMLRQGNRTWKPTRASKYQNSAFQYEKAMTYFYQSEIQPGVYEVLVRVKKGAKNATQKPVSLYGKIIPSGQRTKTYHFGDFAINGESGDWVSAGSFRINAADLQFQPRLPAAAKTETGPEADTPPTATKPAPAPASKPSGRSGKWGK